MDFTDKANALAKKMNELTQKFDLSSEMVISGDDIIEDVKKKTDIKVHKKVWNTISFADQGVTVKSTTEDTDTSSDSSSK